MWQRAVNGGGGGSQFSQGSFTYSNGVKVSLGFRPTYFMYYWQYSNSIYVIEYHNNNGTEKLYTSGGSVYHADRSSQIGVTFSVGDDGVTLSGVNTSVTTMYYAASAD